MPRCAVHASPRQSCPKGDIVHRHGMDFRLVLAEAVRSYSGRVAFSNIFGTMINAARCRCRANPVVWWALATLGLMFGLSAANRRRSAREASTRVYSVITGARARVTAAHADEHRAAQFSAVEALTSSCARGSSRWG